MSIRYFFGDEQEAWVRGGNCFAAKVVFKVALLRIEGKIRRTSAKISRRKRKALVLRVKKNTTFSGQGLTCE
jgi:hypothetical protein